MANEKRTIQSFFAPVAKKAKPVAEAPAAANEASAKEVEAKTKEAPGSSSSIPDAQRQRAEQNKQVAMSKVLQRKAMEVGLQNEIAALKVLDHPHIVKVMQLARPVRPSAG